MSGVIMVLQLCRRMALFLEMGIQIFWGEISDTCNVFLNVAEKIIENKYGKSSRIVKSRWYLNGHPIILCLEHTLKILALKVGGKNSLDPTFPSSYHFITQIFSAKLLRGVV